MPMSSDSVKGGCLYILPEQVYHSHYLECEKESILFNIPFHSHSRCLQTGASFIIRYNFQLQL